MTISDNKTDYTDAEIIAAIEAAVARGENAVCDNCGTDGEQWERVAWYMTIEMADGGSVMAMWRPTAESYEAAKESGDEADACDWDVIDRAECV